MGELVAFNQTPAVSSLSMGEIERVALAIAKGGLFGSTDPNAVLTLCLLAHAEGQHPAVVFRDYHLIKGKPAKKADAMLRDFVSAGGKVDWHALDDTIADATFSHPGGGSVRIDWTMERAKQAQLTTDMWRKYPRQMLRSRVISEGVRTVYPGATSGLYEVGEVQDIVAEQPSRTTMEMPPEVASQVAMEEMPAIEQQPATRGRPKPLEGPIKTRAALRDACSQFKDELDACGDSEMLNAFLEANGELIRQVRTEAERWWKGDGMEFLGMEKEIERRIELVKMAEANAPTMLDAG